MMQHLILFMQRMSGNRSILLFNPILTPKPEYSILLSLAHYAHSI